MKTAEDFLCDVETAFVSEPRTLFEWGDVIEVMKAYALQYANSLPVFRICNHCNTDFELTVANTITERVSAFENCTHCGKRNDTWISIKLSQPQ